MDAYTARLECAEGMARAKQAIYKFERALARGIRAPSTTSSILVTIHNTANQLP